MSVQDDGGRGASVQFCVTQTASLRTAVDSLAGEVRALSDAIKALHDDRITDVEAGATLAIKKLSKDSDFAPLQWQIGADHIGRRWYDSWTKWLGDKWMKFLGGVIVAGAALGYAYMQGLALRPPPLPSVVLTPPVGAPK